DFSGSRSTVRIAVSAAKSTSSSVVERPRPYRMAACARAEGTPIAVHTWEGSREAEVQAEPVETATSFMPTRSASPSTPENETLRLPGSRVSVAPGRSFPSESIGGSDGPFSPTPGSRAVSASWRRPRRRRSRRLSSGNVSTESSAARARPTIPGTFSVPEPMPRSWPPPGSIGSSRTRGCRARTKSAPTPLGPDLVRGDGGEIHGGRDVERHLAEGLDRVRVEQDAALAAHGADGGDVVNDAD